jgi:hypothetical protein
MNGGSHPDRAVRLGGAAGFICVLPKSVRGLGTFAHPLGIGVAAAVIQVKKPAYEQVSDLAPQTLAVPATTTMYGECRSGCDDSVTVVMTTRPRTGVGTCQENEPTPFVLELPEPLGGRTLLDGSSIPARDATLGSGY